MQPEIKRILLIENRADYGMGGVENYNRNLYKILTSNFKNIQIDRAAFLPCENIDEEKLVDKYYHVYKLNSNFRTKNGSYNFFKLAFLFLKFRSLVYKLNRQNKYDLIIDSTITTFRKFHDFPFYFWIQHSAPVFYSMQHIKNKFVRTFIIFFARCFGIKNNLYYAKNLVLFDKYNYQEIKDTRSTPFNAYVINLSNYVPPHFEKELTNNANFKKGILYFGRIDNDPKNIDWLHEINQSLHLIDFYGKGDANLIAKLGPSYKGFISNSNDFQDLFIKYKFMILMSNYEGFPFSLTQSLCYGLPIIVLDTFPSAKYLVNDNQNGFLLKPHQTLDEYTQKIKQFYSVNNEEYLKLSLNAYHFAQANLSDEKFEQKWLKIFHEYLDK